ncbi:MAG: hypothetical protein ACK56L_03885 [Pseudanabaena sp.]
METPNRCYTVLFLSNLSYSLGDAIDWKHSIALAIHRYYRYLLIARGRDRLETTS